MKYILLTLLLIAALQVKAKEIKLSKSDDYYKALQAQTIDTNKKKTSVKHKINNLHPLPPFKKPNLNGNFSQQYTYKQSQKTIKLTADNQSRQN